MTIDGIVLYKYCFQLNSNTSIRRTTNDAIPMESNAVDKATDPPVETERNNSQTTIIITVSLVQPVGATIVCNIFARRNSDLRVVNARDIALQKYQMFLEAGKWNSSAVNR